MHSAAALQTIAHPCKQGRKVDISILRMSRCVILIKEDDNPNCHAKMRLSEPGDAANLCTGAVRPICQPFAELSA